jgi:hypothetical protein
VVWSLIAAAAAGPCALPSPADAAFVFPVQADRVRVILELWPADAPQEWADGVLRVLEQRGLRAALIVPAEPPADDLAALLPRATAAGHEVGMWLNASVVPRDVLEPVGPLRQLVKPVRDVAGSVDLAIAPIGSRASEALLGKAGFNTLVNAEGAPSAEPRMAGVLEGQPGVHIVLPSGPYEDACGADPRSAPFTPRAADRAGAAIQKAQRAPGTPMVRVALDGRGGAETDAKVLGRWIDEVLVPGGVTVVTPGEARLVAAQAFRRGLPAAAPSGAGGGRLVALDVVGQAAAAVAEGDVLDRTLPGELNLTEAFVAFLFVSSGRTEGTVVRLSTLSGPATMATTTLSGPTEVPAEAVRAVAVALVAELPSEVPAAMSVGGRLLTASELLIAFAGVARGQDPVTVRPVGVPDPNQRGLGWGVSTIP